MSETEDEPFDKEAEKEKLRQQLAEEEEARQSTQRMSELLLKGATMTNHHCDECGDPLFRHEGREFCPTCGRERLAADDEAEDETEAGEASGAGDADFKQTSRQPAATAHGTTATQPASTGEQPQTTRDLATGAADLPAARDALARKVTALAQEAEATTDVGRARELLAAVREGAEALRALEGAGR